jgi:hypothetical protein
MAYVQGGSLNSLRMDHDMKTRILFLTLFAPISILLITNGLAFADSITGCVKKSTGVIYNVQTGDTPTYPCHFLDEQITWSEEGPQGPAGENGEDGADGQDGTIIHQVHLEDSNDPACETGSPPLIGWCPDNSSLGSYGTFCRTHPAN